MERTISTIIGRIYTLTGMGHRPKAKSRYDTGTLFDTFLYSS